MSKPADSRAPINGSYRLKKYINPGVNNVKPWLIQPDKRDEGIVQEFIKEHSFGTKLFVQGTSILNKRQSVSCYQWHLMCKRHNSNGRGGRDSMDTIEDILRSYPDYNEIFRFFPPYSMEEFKEVKRMILVHNDTIKTLNKIAKVDYTGDFIYNEEQSLNLIETRKVMDSLIPKLTRRDVYYNNSFLFKDEDFLNEYIEFDYGVNRQDNTIVGEEFGLNRALNLTKDMTDVEKIKETLLLVSFGNYKDVIGRLHGRIIRDEKITGDAKKFSNNFNYPTNKGINEVIDYIVKYTTLNTIKNILLKDLDDRSFKYGELELYANYNDVYEWKDYSYNYIEKDKVLKNIKKVELDFYEDIDKGYKNSIILFMNLLEVYGLNIGLINNIEIREKEEEYIKVKYEKERNTFMDNKFLELLKIASDSINDLSIDDVINLFKGKL